MVLAFAGLSTMTRFLLMTKILRLQRNALTALNGCRFRELSSIYGDESTSRRDEYKTNG